MYWFLVACLQRSFNLFLASTVRILQISPLLAHSNKTCARRGVLNKAPNRRFFCVPLLPAFLLQALLCTPTRSTLPFTVALPPPPCLIIHATPFVFVCVPTLPVPSSQPGKTNKRNETIIGGKKEQKCVDASPYLLGRADFCIHPELLLHFFDLVLHVRFMWTLHAVQVQCVGVVVHSKV